MNQKQAGLYIVGVGGPIDIYGYGFCHGIHFRQRVPAIIEDTKIRGVSGGWLHRALLIFIPPAQSEREAHPVTTDYFGESVIWRESGMAATSKKCAHPSCVYRAKAKSKYCS